MSSREELQKKGLFLGTYVPYGYKRDPDDKYHLVIDEEVGTVVRSIFRWYAKDELSMREIAYKLNDLNIPCPTEQKRLRGEAYSYSGDKDKHIYLWSPSSIRGILTNPVYLGHVVQGRYKKNPEFPHKKLRPEDEWIIVKNKHTPIIDQDVFDFAKKRLEDNAYDLSSRNIINIYAGFLRCADCGYAMALYPNKEDRELAYICRTYLEKSKTACTRHYILESIINDGVLRAIRSHINALLSIEGIIKEIGGSQKIQNKIRRINTEIGSYEKMLEQAFLDRVTLIKDLYNGKTQKDVYDQRNIVHDSHIADLNCKLSALRQERELICYIVDAAYLYFQRFYNYDAIAKLSKNVLLDIVDTIFIHEDGNVEVIFSYKEDNEKLISFIERFL